MIGARVPSVTSKLPTRRSNNEFYRYYAGYPVDFAEWAIRELNLPAGGRAIDPWNGSGTTAAACARLGISFHGYDINPVMVHLGRARIAAAADFAEAHALIDAVAEILAGEISTRISALGKVFRELPVTSETAHSIAIAALFPLARQLLTGSKTKNPSWFKRSATLRDKVLPTNGAIKQWRTLVEQVARWRGTQDDFDGLTLTVERGDSRKSLGRPESFDGLLTSPPYLTRLDYVQATFPEFLLLSEFDTMPDAQRLRRSMLGSPLTTSRSAESLERLPLTIQNLLKQIAAHDSKASSSYYHRFFAAYFIDLHASMRNITKVLKSGAAGCVVVQSSHYKEIEVDLARAVTLLGKQFGLAHIRTNEFNSRRSMSLVNSRAHASAQQPKNEYAVFLRKE